MEQCPELVVHKNTIFGADKAELENLLCFIDEEFYLVVDGLDHISREYELHKDLISRSETGIISELLEIHFPDNCYVIISSQPIDEMEEFKGKNYSVFEIEPWGIEQTKSLMVTFQINDDTIEDDDISSISAYLLKKSQGNALYLSYILRQLRSVDVNKELIDEIPDYDINLSSLISKYNQSEALEHFDMCTRYLVAYGYHKDIILEQVMDSYNIFFEAVAGNPEEERDTITKMTIALWNHTDGRETKHFLNRWLINCSRQT